MIGSAVFVVLAVGLTSCRPPATTGEELFDQARAVYLDYRSAVAEAQLEIFDGEWLVDKYGDSPDECGAAGYEFSFGRSTPPEWKIDGTPAEAARRLADWLNDNGWSEITTRTYSEGIADVVVEAEKPDSHVGHITVDISPGEFYDITTIYLDSTCEPGDWAVIYDLQNPGDPNWRDIEPHARTEHPLADSSFGYTQEGRPRFWTGDAD